MEHTRYETQRHEGIEKLLKPLVVTLRLSLVWMDLVPMQWKSEFGLLDRMWISYVRGSWYYANVLKYLRIQRPFWRVLFLSVALSTSVFVTLRRYSAVIVISFKGKCSRFPFLILSIYVPGAPSSSIEILVLPCCRFGNVFTPFVKIDRFFFYCCNSRKFMWYFYC